MKNLFLCFLLFMGYGLNAQELLGFHGGEYTPPTQEYPCLTHEQRALIQSEINLSRENLIHAGILPAENDRLNPPTFIWPVTQADGFEYNNVFGISNFVDHNPAYPNQTLDYNCGARTYDLNSGYNHQGVDIFTWPFGWRQMNNNQAIIIAAAPGTILYKSDGNYDRNCQIAGDVTWNAVYVQHVDGSVAWYGHMKNGSLTNKNVGETVNQGEFLGVIGSSGYSTGPHLHFEVYDSAQELMDVFPGDCNPYHSSHPAPFITWENLRDYREPMINTVLTHDAAPVFNPCPEEATLNLRSQFLPGEQVYNVIYLSDQIQGDEMNLKLRKPDGTYLYDWAFEFPQTFNASYYYWYFTFTEEDYGEWEFSAEYGGDIITTNFEIVESMATEQVEMEKEFVRVYPNPASEYVHIEYAGKIENVEMYSMSGELILTSNEKRIKISHLLKGSYILKIVTEYGTFHPKILVK